MKAFSVFLCSIILLFAAVACVPSAPKVATTTVKNPSNCSLQVGTIQTVAAGLNKVDQCVKQMCSVSALETHDIAGYSGNWLYFGPDKSFNLTEVSAFQTDAKSRAIAATPAGKRLLHINYFTDLLVANGPSHVVLGAKAQYGICSTLGAGHTNTN